MNSKHLEIVEFFLDDYDGNFLSLENDAKEKLGLSLIKMKGSKGEPTEKSFDDFLQSLKTASKLPQTSSGFAKTDFQSFFPHLFAEIMDHVDFKSYDYTSNSAGSPQALIVAQHFEEKIPIKEIASHMASHLLSRTNKTSSTNFVGIHLDFWNAEIIWIENLTIGQQLTLEELKALERKNIRLYSFNWFWEDIIKLVQYLDDHPSAEGIGGGFTSIHRLYFIVEFLKKIVHKKGERTLSVLIQGQEIVLTIAEITVPAGNAVFNEYALNYTWSFFALKDGKEYNLTTWGIAGKCGCSTQICGIDCSGSKGIDCASNEIESTFLCAYKGFCWNLVPTTISQNYTLYNLTHISTIALTSFSGPAAKYMSPGFTIQNQLHNQGYSLNAMITGYTTSNQADLQNYRYCESEGRVITTEEFAIITSKPKLTNEVVQIEKSSCDGEVPKFSANKIITNLDNIDRIGFHTYMILRTAEAKSLFTLADKNILSTNAVLTWNNQKTFDILDPCNQQFLTLQLDSMGNFFVKLPVIQTLMKGDIICIAINDIFTNIYDLVLYELKNGTSVWRASDRFRGLLSKDYLKNLQLTATIKANEPIILPEDVQVEIDFNFEVDPPLLMLTTSIPLTCQIFLSKNCIFTLTTTKESFYQKKPIDSCGFWYAIGKYICDGIVGHFHSPPNFAEAPISAYSENTTAIEVSSFETISASYIPSNQSWLKKLTWFEKLWFVIIILVLVLMIVYGWFISYQVKQLTLLNKNQEIEMRQKDNEYNGLLERTLDDDEDFIDKNFNQEEIDMFADFYNEDD